MTLAEKLDRLRLPTMSRQLDQALQHAAEKSLSPAAALEWLADLELEARNGRAVQRRFHFSTSSTRAPTSSWWAIPARARPSCRKSSAGGPVRLIVASCSPPPWICSTN